MLFNDYGTNERFLDGDRAEIGGLQRTEGAEELADGRARRAHDVDTGHGETSSYGSEPWPASVCGGDGAGNRGILHEGFGVRQGSGGPVRGARTGLAKAAIQAGVGLAGKIPVARRRGRITRDGGDTLRPPPRRGRQTATRGSDPWESIASPLSFLFVHPRTRKETGAREGPPRAVSLETAHGSVTRPVLSRLDLARPAATATRGRHDDHAS